MVNYERALKKPFTDMRKLVVGALLSLIPIVNFTIVKGFAIECSSLGKSRKKKALPDWEDMSYLFRQGLKAWIINFVYMIPALIVFAVTIGMVAGDISALILNAFATTELIPEMRMSISTTFQTSEMLKEMVRGRLYMIVPILIRAAPVFMLGAFLALLALFFAPMAILHSVKKKKLSSAFEFRTVFNKTMNIRYIVAWVVAMLISVIIIDILSIIPLLGIAIGFFIAEIIKYSLFGDVYNEVK